MLQVWCPLKQHIVASDIVKYTVFYKKLIHQIYFTDVSHKVAVAWAARDIVGIST